MKKTFHIVCRGSWLSLAQAELFSNKVKQYFPGTELKVIERYSEGDKNQSTPLHLVEGKDFFTKDIQDFLKDGGADFAVHSMKDVSSEDFFSDSGYAFFDREDIRDVAIFNEGIMEKLQQGATVNIGTSSPRRGIMAVNFLKKAMPWLGMSPRVEATSVRGNVDKRLRQLNDGKYDGLILAAAGLNRLLRYEPARETIIGLLRNKKMMLLPLFECPPAAGQGAVVVETNLHNADAIAVLKAIDDADIKKAIRSERVFADKYGYGCSKEFGVFHLNIPGIEFTYAAGQNDNGYPFSEWRFHIEGLSSATPSFSATDNMKHFFEYRYLNDAVIHPNAKALFIASHKAIHSHALVTQCKKKNIWAAGVKTWMHLAQKGIWVQGCADGLGLNILNPVWEAPLFHLNTGELQVITNTGSTHHWQSDGLMTAATYELLPALQSSTAKEAATATSFFWTSFQQYELCKPFLQAGVTHACPAGKTAELLQQAGLEPVIFPTIKAYQQWKQSSIHSHNAA
jgi:hydroxymethylbilane synthase